MKKIRTLLIFGAVGWTLFLISPYLFLATAFICLWLFDDRIADYLWGNKKDEPEEETKFNCERCEDTGLIEIMGDGDNFEWDVIGHKRCKCQEDWDN